MDSSIKNKVLERYNFTCQKCGFQDKSSEEIEIHHINPKIFDGEDNLNNLIVLCSVCHHYSPDSKEEFERYISEKIDWKVLETFRKSNRSISKRTKQGMLNRFKQGIHLTKAPKGYKLVNKKLVLNELEALNVKKIFQEFVETDISLTQLSKKHNMTTAGIKKLLQNSTYLGKIKFASQESQGHHPILIEKELFDRVQEKLKNL